MATLDHLSVADIVSWLFVITNGGRIVAYLPQIVSAWRCPAGAKSVSLLTWSYFALAHATAVIYSVLILNDARATWIFAGNLAVTTLLVAVLLWKRGTVSLPASFNRARRLPAFLRTIGGSTSSHIDKSLRSLGNPSFRPAWRFALGGIAILVSAASVAGLLGLAGSDRGPAGKAEEGVEQRLREIECTSLVRQLASRNQSMLSGGAFSETVARAQTICVREPAVFRRMIR